MIKRSITVRGCGQEKIAPDHIAININLQVHSADYAQLIKKSDEDLEELRSAIISAGFLKNDLKTVDYNIETEYEGVYDDKGNYHQSLKGYLVRHDLCLGFPLDMERLSKVLNKISACKSEPEFHISFSVHNTEEAKERMLRSTTSDAKKQAKILCESAGVILGQLVSMEYEWSNLDFTSVSHYSMRRENVCMTAKAMAPVDFVPEDVAVSLSAIFVWEIL